MKTHIKKLHIGSCFLLMCSMAERLRNDFSALFGVFRFEVFLHDQLFEAVDVYIGRIPDHATLSLTGLGLSMPIISAVIAFANLFGI